MWSKNSEIGDRSKVDDSCFYQKVASVSGTGKFFTDVCLSQVKLSDARLLDIVVSAYDGSLSFYCLNSRTRAEKQRKTAGSDHGEYSGNKITIEGEIEIGFELEFMHSTAPSVEGDQDP